MTSKLTLLTSKSNNFEHLNQFPTKKPFPPLHSIPIPGVVRNEVSGLKNELGLGSSSSGSGSNPFSSSSSSSGAAAQQTPEEMEKARKEERKR